MAGNLQAQVVLGTAPGYDDILLLCNLSVLDFAKTGIYPYKENQYNGTVEAFHLLLPLLLYRLEESPLMIGCSSCGHACCCDVLMLYMHKKEQLRQSRR